MKGRDSGMPAEADWDSFFNPTCILDRLNCTGKFDVVEFGCGYGTFTIPAARQVSGKVFALDIELAMIVATKKKADEDDLANVDARVRDFVAQGSGMPDESMGYAMLFNILHIEDPIGLLREAHRVLSPGGIVGIIHWRSDVPTPRGPSPDIRPTAEQCRRWAEDVGLQFVRDESLCCCSWHWGLVMQRPKILHPMPS